MALRGRAGPDAAVLRRRALGRGVSPDGAAVPLRCFRRHGAATLHLVLWTCSVSPGARDLQRRARAVGAHAATASHKRAGLLRRALVAGAGRVRARRSSTRGRPARRATALSARGAVVRGVLRILARRGAGRSRARRRRGAAGQRIAAQLEHPAVFFTAPAAPLVWGAGVLGAVGDARAPAIMLRVVLEVRRRRRCRGTGADPRGFQSAAHGHRRGPAQVVGYGCAVRVAASWMSAPARELSPMMQLLSTSLAEGLVMPCAGEIGAEERKR